LYWEGRKNSTSIEGEKIDTDIVILKNILEISPDLIRGQAMSERLIGLNPGRFL